MATALVTGSSKGIGRGAATRSWASSQRPRKEAATAPLLTSPLQVMLFFQLVAIRATIPKDRWTLFQRHYELLRDREVSKGGVSGNTIRDFQQQIDGIHADAGFLLHLRAEAAGHAESRAYVRSQFGW